MVQGRLVGAGVGCVKFGHLGQALVGHVHVPGGGKRVGASARYLPRFHVFGRDPAVPGRHLEFLGDGGVKFNSFLEVLLAHRPL